MRNLNEAKLTDAVLAKLEHASDARFKEIMESLVRNLHAFVRETELTEADSKKLPMWADIATGLEGTPTFVSGAVSDVNGKPIGGATLDVWRADGRFGFRTVKPVSYPIPTDGPVGRMLLRMGRHPYRPAHVHTIVSAPGFETVTTHIFVKGDRYLGSDAVFGVKDSLVADFEEHAPGPTPDGGKSAVPFSTARYDFRLVRS